MHANLARQAVVAILYTHGGSAGRTLDGSHFLGYNVVNLASARLPPG